MSTESLVRSHVPDKEAEGNHQPQVIDTAVLDHTATTRKQKQGKQSILLNVSVESAHSKAVGYFLLKPSWFKI